MKQKNLLMRLIMAFALLLTVSLNVQAGDVNLRKGGSIVGKIESNGSVRLNGSIVGRFESNGDIRVGGSIEGRIEKNGDIRKRGSIVGRIESNGDVRISGSIIGRVEKNGDIRYKGSIIGRAEQMTDVRQVAVMYFFGFFVNRKNIEVFEGAEVRHAILSYFALKGMDVSLVDSLTVYDRWGHEIDLAAPASQFDAVKFKMK